MVFKAIVKYALALLCSMPVAALAVPYGMTVVSSTSTGRSTATLPGVEKIYASTSAASGSPNIILNGIDGSITAVKYYGDGSALANLPRSSNTVVEAYANNGTLGVGTTFYAFTAGADLTLRKLVATVYEPGSNGDSTFRCGSVTDFIDIVINGAYTIGQRISSVVNRSVGKDVEVTCFMVATSQDITPTVALSLQYTVP